MYPSEPPIPNSNLEAAGLQARIEALEQELMSSRAAHAAALSELDDLARFLSHDLRAPLRGIDGYSKALVMEYGSNLDGVGTAYLRYISESGRSAAKLVDQLIQYIRTPRATLKLQPIDLSAAALEAAETMRSRYNGRAVTAVIQPGLTAIADPRLVGQLLDNLLDNAWKFTARSAQARVEFGIVEAAAPPEYFVADNGAGFNMRYAANLFEPFQRLHSAHEFEGAGMGLAVARRIVARHGGRIRAAAEENAGAAIYFTLEPDRSKGQEGEVNDRKS